MRRKGPMGWLAHDVTHRGVTAWMLTIALAMFYVVLYWGDGPNGVNPLDKIAWLLHLGRPGQSGAKWTLYGTLYTLAVTLGGIGMIRRYGHNRYQVVRTMVVVFVQSTFAFSVPLFMKFAGHPEHYFSYFWPLKMYYFEPGFIRSNPAPLVLWSLIGSMVLVPVLGVFFGKRWYCSWVCGCGGLANTAGEPFRALSDKSERAWRFEKITIHASLALTLVTTAVVLASAFVPGNHPVLDLYAVKFRESYALIVSALLSGVVGVAAYPVGGTRVWCRYFCPMAAMLGLLQKAGRFRIRVKKDMCISCGMCSNYCEMGIDVRSYAQANESFTRASCVGCGMCAEVCPRGVLTLENSRKRDPQEQLVQIRLKR
ncbi:MAG: 4Fe-4S binding protein [Deltaproteobacteria bacterium]|nr:4Fe-4S binding protein [Deltaproteobacteria bacterium]